MTSIGFTPVYPGMSWSVLHSPDLVWTSDNWEPSHLTVYYANFSIFSWQKKVSIVFIKLLFISRCLQFEHFFSIYFDKENIFVGSEYSALIITCLLQSRVSPRNLSCWNRRRSWNNIWQLILAIAITHHTLYNQPHPTLKFLSENVL